MTTMSVVGECFFWYRLTRVVPDKFHRAVKRLCVCVCVHIVKGLGKSTMHNEECRRSAHLPYLGFEPVGRQITEVCVKWDIKPQLGQSMTLV